MRMFRMRAALIAAVVLLVGRPLAVQAEESAIIPGGVQPLRVQSPAEIVRPPVGIAITPLVASAPAEFYFRAQPPRQLGKAPPPEHYIQPGIGGVFAQLRASNGKGLKEVRLKVYQPYHSPDTPPDPAHFYLRQIVVKFVEGSSVRLREGRLVASEEPAATETRARLGRIGLEPAMVATDLAMFNKDVAAAGGFTDRSAPTVDELDLLRLRQAAERSSGFEQPDLNLFYFVALPDMRPEDALRVLQRLRGYRSVEVAYFQPIPFDATDKAPTTTLDVFASQGYLRAAPRGIDVDFARNFGGGRGEGVRIVDVESGWNINHEDLPPLFFRYGTNFGGDHGTAVLGELVAEENAFGATGIAPRASAGWSSVSGIAWKDGTIYFYSVGYALLVSLDALRAGDLALIEQHYPSNAGPAPANFCNPEQWGYVAMETFAFEHAVISQLSGAGVIVVEAAGNGGQLVAPASTRDSGAIVVGASRGSNVNTGLGADPTARVPACFTNFGPRVDVHAWGGGVGTISYGTGLFGRVDSAGKPVLNASGMQIVDELPDASVRANGNDADQWYYRLFSGTSSASPIVTGAAALVQSTRVAAGYPPLTPAEMRTLLVTTGTPQTPDAKNIGPLPNLRAAFAAMFPDHARFSAQDPAPGPLAPGAAFNLKVSFQNTGGIAWIGGHVVQVAPTQSGPSAFGAPTIAVGTPSIAVNPNGVATATFSLVAPAVAGTYPLGFWIKAPNGAVLANSPAQNIIVGTPPADTATLTFASPPSDLPMGIPGLVVVIAKNTGTITWAPQSRSLRIWNPSQNLTLSTVTLPVTTTVAPGQSFTFNFQVTCRATGPAGYSTQLNANLGTNPVSPVAGRSVNCTQ